jgi:hypothetical protein
MTVSPDFRDFSPALGMPDLVIPIKYVILECGPGDAASPKSRMLQRWLDTVVLTVVAILFSAAVVVLKYRRV